MSPTKGGYFTVSCLGVFEFIIQSSKLPHTKVTLIIHGTSSNFIQVDEKKKHANRIPGQINKRAFLIENHRRPYTEKKERHRLETV